MSTFWKNIWYIKINKISSKILLLQIIKNSSHCLSFTLLSKHNFSALSSLDCSAVTMYIDSSTSLLNNVSKLLCVYIYTHYNIRIKISISWIRSRIKTEHKSSKVRKNL